MPVLLRLLTMAAVFVAVVLNALVPHSGALLSAARQALGSEAALGAVGSLTITGSVSTDIGAIVLVSHLEVDAALPDRFVRITRRTMSRGPTGTFDITERRGFNGADPIQETIAPTHRFPL